MKTISITVLFLLISWIGFAQWNTNGSNTNNGTFKIYPSGNAGTNAALKLLVIPDIASTVLQANSDFAWTDHSIIINAANTSGGNTNQFTIHKTGSIGMGTSSPFPNLNNKGLHIGHDGHSSLLFGNPVTNGYGGIVQTSDNKHRIFIGANLYDDPELSWNNFQSGKGSAGISILADEGSWGTGIDFYTSKNNNQPIGRVHIDGDGRVGIGTATPKFRLEVGGNEQIAAGITFLDNTLEIDNNYTRSNFGSNVYWDAVNNRWQVNAIGANDFSSVIHPNGGGIIFLCGSSTANAPRSFTHNEFSAFARMKITADGNVGIGTESPDAKLAVKGQIHAQEVRVDLLGAVAPDYVFEKDYDLLPLAKLETYITENKHLPEIPSAKEMEANGLNLKDMNLLLLKKVEELTLHMIELKKYNEEQDLLIQKLNKN